jgi:hypothetical protein
MSRYYAKIDHDEFKEKIDKVFELFEDEYSFGDTIDKDLAKVEFDKENISRHNGKDSPAGFPYPVGIQTIGDDLKVCFFWAGGDWEYPVCFILYWDGKQLRGYIPTKGNAFDKKNKMAYGNEDDGRDTDDYNKEVSYDLLVEDILNRIKPQPK